MNSIYNEEMLAAFALDELETSQQAVVSEFVQTNSAARETVEEYRHVARLAKQAIKYSPQLELDELRRNRILLQAQKPPLGSFILKRFVAVAAAALLLIAGASIIVPAAKKVSSTAGMSTAPPQADVAIRRDGDVESFGRGAEEVAAGREERAYFVGFPVASPAGDAGSTGGEGKGADEKGAMRGLVPSSPQPDRYLIKTASVDIETADARKAAADFAAQAAALGGFVGNLNETTDNLGRHMVMLEVRVPADKLDGALQALDAFGKVLDKQVKAQDVTEEYVDNESRIRNLTKTEERLLDHLGKTSTMDNTLKIEAELNRVREQLELIQGRQRVLSHRVAFSSIRATFTETPKAESVVPPQTFSIGKVLTEAVRSLIGFGREFVTKLIWVAVWTPVWAPFVLAGLLIWRRFARETSGA